MAISSNRNLVLFPPQEIENCSGKCGCYIVKRYTHFAAYKTFIYKRFLPNKCLWHGYSLWPLLILTINQKGLIHYHFQDIGSDGTVKRTIKRKIITNIVRFYCIVQRLYFHMKSSHCCRTILWTFGTLQFGHLHINLRVFWWCWQYNYISDTKHAQLM